MDPGGYCFHGVRQTTFPSAQSGPAAADICRVKQAYVVREARLDVLSGAAFGTHSWALCFFDQLV